MLLPYEVIDQNALQNPDLLGPAIDRAHATGVKLMLTDAVFIETTKGEQWEKSTYRAFRRLAEVPGLVVAGRGVPELLRMERASGRPSYSDLVDQGATEAVRRLLSELPQRRGRALDYFLSAVPKAKPRAESEYLNHGRNKERLLRFRDTISELLAAQGARRVKKDKQLQRDILASPQLSAGLAASIERGLGCDSDTASALAQGRSVIAHSLLGQATLAMWWFVNSGLDGAAPTKITNDEMDLEYITLASFCDRLVSADKKANELMEDLRAVIEQRRVQAE